MVALGAFKRVTGLCFLSTLLFIGCIQAATGKAVIYKAGSRPRFYTMPYSQDAVINTGNTTPAQLIAFARSLTGTPYLYGSVEPDKGFDCSGFISYVFNHFNIAVPRSSTGFTAIGKQVQQTDAKPGDLILFTGTNSNIKTVGHMGIIVSANKNGIRFIHATSGKANGVTETSVSPNYLPRLVKIIRVF